MSVADLEGSIAYILYRGGAIGEELVDDRSAGSPLPVMIGAGRVPKGIEEAICSMEVGESKTVRIPPEKGYSFYNKKDVQWYTRALIPNGYSLKTGDVVTLSHPEDKSVRVGRVIEETDDLVRIDFNHPYAGKELEYWIKLVDLKQG